MIHDSNPNFQESAKVPSKSRIIPSKDASAWRRSCFNRHAGWLSDTEVINIIKVWKKCAVLWVFESGVILLQYYYSERTAKLYLQKIQHVETVPEGTRLNGLLRSTIRTKYAVLTVSTRKLLSTLYHIVTITAPCAAEFLYIRLHPLSPGRMIHRRFGCRPVALSLLKEFITVSDSY